MKMTELSHPFSWDVSCNSHPADGSTNEAHKISTASLDTDHPHNISNK